MNTNKLLLILFSFYFLARKMTHLSLDLSLKIVQVSGGRPYVAAQTAPHITMTVMPRMTMVPARRSLIMVIII